MRLVLGNEDYYNNQVTQHDSNGGAWLNHIQVRAGRFFVGQSIGGEQYGIGAWEVTWANQVYGWCGSR